MLTTIKTGRERVRKRTEEEVEKVGEIKKEMDYMLKAKMLFL